MMGNSKRVINGDVRFDPSVDYSDVEEITGWLDCRGADTTALFPRLTTVGGGLDCRGADTRVAFPRLTTVGGGLDCRGADTRVAFPRLTTVGGWLDCSGADTRVAFPRLTTVGGWLDCRGADTTAAFPRLTTVGGGLDCRGADTTALFPRLTTVGGGLDCSGADTRVAFPRLTTVGGGLDCSWADTRVAFPRLRKTKAGNALAKSKVCSAFRRKGYLFADGILTKIVETKRTRGGALIHKVVAVGKAKESYCIEADGVFSHGDTIKEARESLLYKVGERDTSAYSGWTRDRKMTAQEAIASYRVITGACEAGVRGFVQAHGKLKKTYTVQEVIDLTVGQYGHAEYAAFFTHAEA